MREHLCYGTFDILGKILGYLEFGDTYARPYLAISLSWELVRLCFPLGGIS